MTSSSSIIGWWWSCMIKINSTSCSFEIQIIRLTLSFQMHISAFSNKMLLCKVENLPGHLPVEGPEWPEVPASYVTILKLCYMHIPTTTYLKHPPVEGPEWPDVPASYVTTLKMYYSNYNLPRTFSSWRTWVARCPSLVLDHSKIILFQLQLT